MRSAVALPLTGDLAGMRIDRVVDAGVVTGCDAGAGAGQAGLKARAGRSVRAGACGSQARAGPCRQQRSRR